MLGDVAAMHSLAASVTAAREASRLVSLLRSCSILCNILLYAVSTL